MDEVSSAVVWCDVMVEGRRGCNNAMNIVRICIAVRLSQTDSRSAHNSVRERKCHLGQGNV